nr:uncharacterized protein LOC119181555 [Rhipicephalus microplus]
MPSSDAPWVLFEYPPAPSTTAAIATDSFKKQHLDTAFSGHESSGLCTALSRYFFTMQELAILVDGYEANRRAIESRGEGPRGSQAKHRAWDNITATLFAVLGIVRTPAEVRKKWCDVKSAIKARDEQRDNPFIAELSIPGPSNMAYEELEEGTCDAIRNVPSSAGSSQEDGDSATGEPQQRSSSTPRRRQQRRSYTSEKLFT